jgi:hypothetical protein
MMRLSLARSAFMVVALAAVGAAVFRVSTAPERVKERRDTARAVCTSSGGEWVRVGKDEICRKDEPGVGLAKKS